MCCVDHGARAVPICGRRRPPSPIAAADVTDNYSIAAVKVALSHPIAQSVMKVTKRGYAGGVGVGPSAAGSGVYKHNIFLRLKYRLLLSQSHKFFLKKGTISAGQVGKHKTLNTLIYVAT